LKREDFEYPESKLEEVFRYRRKISKVYMYPREVIRRSLYLIGDLGYDQEISVSDFHKDQEYYLMMRNLFYFYDLDFEWYNGSEYQGPLWTLENQRSFH